MAGDAPIAVEVNANASVAGAVEADGTAVKRTVSLTGSGLRAYTPTLWRMQQNRGERPKQERDSLRSRSKEGRPGSRKHRRWTRSQELKGSLRKAMVACGESCDNVDFENFKEQFRLEYKPSAFYKLLEAEGPGHALEVWNAAENARRPRSRPRLQRPKTEAQVEAQNARAARQAFGCMWRYIHDDTTAKELLLELEEMATCAFASGERGNTELLQEWLLLWDGAELTTQSGNPPAVEMGITGLTSAERKCVHALAQLLGLHSASKISNGPGPEGDGKVLTMRPPRSRCGSGKTWAAPLSLARMLAVKA